MSLIATFLFFLPLAIMLLRGLWSDRFLRIYSIYCAIEGLINVLDLFPSIPFSFISRLNVFYNMLDFPLMIFLLYQITVPEKFRQIMKYGTGVYILWQLYYAFEKGLQYDALKYPMGLGLLLVLISVFWMLANYIQRPDLRNREKTYMAIMAAILFDYGTFVVIYIFDYFVINSSIKDNLLIYYASSIVSMLITVVALLIARNKPEIRKKPKEKIFYGKPITEIY